MPFSFLLADVKVWRWLSVPGVSPGQLSVVEVHGEAVRGGDPGRGATRPSQQEEEDGRIGTARSGEGVSLYFMEMLVLS